METSNAEKPGHKPTHQSDPLQGPGPVAAFWVTYPPHGLNGGSHGCQKTVLGVNLDGDNVPRQ